MVLDVSDWAFAVLIAHKHITNRKIKHWQDASGTRKHWRDASAAQFTAVEMGVDASRLIMQVPLS